MCLSLLFFLIFAKGCELFFRTLVRGHVGDEVCCPVFEDAPALLAPESAADLTAPMLFPVVGCWLRDGALHGFIKFDGRAAELMRVAPGDALAFGTNAEKLPSLGLVLSVDASGSL